MEVHARAPDPLAMGDDMASNWHSWKEDFIIFMKITEYIDKPNEIRANFLKNRIGKVGIDAIQSFTFDKPEDKDDMDILIAKLEEHFNPPKKEVVERYHFFSRAKKQNETIEQYINILKDKAKTCNFNEMTESLILDKIILDTHDKILRKKFFEVENLDLQKLVAIYNDYSTNIEKMKQVTKENRTEEVNFAQKPQISNDTKRPPCWRCSQYHLQGKCPAWGSKCAKCNDVNHFTHCCKGYKPAPKGNNNIKVNKNLFDAAQKPNHLVIPKRNDAWNNRANSGNSITIKPKQAMSSLPDIPTISDGVATPFLGNVVASDFVMVDARATTNSNANYKNTVSQSVYASKTTVNPTSSSAMGTIPGTVTAARTTYTSTSTNASQNYTARSSVYKNPKPSGKKKNEDSCVLC